MKGTSLVRLAGTLGALIFPFLASAADCWLRDGAAPTPTNVIVLCQQGRVYVSSDAGSTWTPYETKAEAPARAISFSDAQHGYVVGDYGMLFATEDGGKTWQERRAPKGERFTSEHLQSVFAIGNRVWAAGFDGTILASVDGGKTFAPQKSGTTFGLENVFFADQDHGWIVGWSGCILRTEDGGKTWQNVSAKAANWSLSWVIFRDSNIGWAVGFNGQLLRSRDGGKVWEVQKAPVNDWLKSLAVDRSNRVWIATDEQLLVSRDNEKWEVVKVDRPLFMRRMLAVGNNLWSIGQLGIYVQAANTSGWKQLDSLVAEGSSTDTFYKKAGSN